MKHPLSVRSLLVALIVLSTLLVSPLSIGAESQPAVMAVTATVTATATPAAPQTTATRRRTFGWPTVTPTPTAAVTPVTATATTTATLPVTGTLGITATAAITTSDATVAPLPVRLRIPTIGVDAAIEAVGQDRSGRMDIPSLVDDVAWYGPGAAPGEIGNAVMAGHLDRVGGAPAVFWKLGNLVAGDDIFVIDEAGTEFHFRVTAQASYAYEDAPLDAIFGFGIRSRLNLITCRGKWDRGKQTYTQRLVVYSELVDTANP